MSCMYISEASAYGGTDTTRLSLRYIKALHTYLLSFIKRAQPLVDIESQQREAETIFNQQWEAGLIEGWEEAVFKQSAENGTGIWCAACKCRPHSNSSSPN